MSWRKAFRSLLSSGSKPTRKGGRYRNNPKELNARLLAVLKFLLKFNIFAIPLYLIILSGYQAEGLITATADIVEQLLSLTGTSFERTGLIFSVPVDNGNWGAVINWDCVGWKSLLAIFALVMATDYPMRKKLKGLAVLLPAVYIANILRIVFLIWYVAAYDIAYFSIVHAVLWSWGLALLILGSWVLWLKSVR
ncbi:MAG: exosortase/archaeosortase family protein [Candidatus Aenigmarchaeota archaeon]|nr:exosortase/archaeosortase family protein [Candidatus Aenigmarchaeota archaeon]